MEAGIVYKVYDASVIEKEVLGFAQKLMSETSAESIAATKKMLSEIQHMPTPEALQYAAGMNATARGSKDCKKGIASFLEKKEISW